MKLLLSTITLSSIITLGYVAEASTPGEMLYPIKVGVTEPVETAIALDTQAQAEVQAALFAERIEEIEQLSIDGRLNTETSEELREDIASQFEETFALILELEADGEIRDAAVARAIMQNAIDYHMQHEIAPSAELRTALNVYSRIMTESLIEQSMQV